MRALMKKSIALVLASVLTLFSLPVFASAASATASEKEASSNPAPMVVGQKAIAEDRLPVPDSGSDYAAYALVAVLVCLSASSLALYFRKSEEIEGVEGAE